MIGAVLGMSGQLGSALSGYPLMMLKQNYGWAAVFQVMVACSALLLSCLWTLRSLKPVPVEATAATSKTKVS